MSTDGWEMPVLADLVEDAIGGLWGRSPDTAESDEVDVLVVRGADFRSWGARRAADAAPRRIPARSLSRRRLEPGDLVIEVSGGSPAQPVGRVIVIDERAVNDAPLPLICSNFCRKVRLKPGVDPYFVKRQLDWLYGSGHTDAFQTSTTNIRNLQVEDFLRGTTIATPAEDVQRTLTALLDKADKARSVAVAHIGSATRVSERLRQAILAAACSGRLTADWRETDQGGEAAEDLIERSRVGTAARRSRSAEEWIAPDWLDLPASWRWAPLSDLAAIRGGIQKQPKRAPRENSYPYLRVANVLRGRLDLREVHNFELFNGELESYQLAKGDLLIVEGNGSPSEIGRAALWDGSIENCVHQNHIIRARLTAVDPQFVEMFWNSPIGSREVAAHAVTTAGLYSLSTKKVAAIPIPVPPLREQLEVVRRASELMAVGETLLQRIARAQEVVELSSQALLGKAFRGDLIAA